MKVLSYYDILEVSKNASSSEIRKAYFNLAKTTHPDKVEEGQKEEATKKFRLISEAYEILFDEDKRREYDNIKTSVPKPAKPTKQPKEEIIVEACGKVVYVNVKNNKIFHIFAEKAGKKFKCIYEDFLPVRVGDALLGLAKYEKRGKTETLFFTEPPVVVMGGDRDTILDCILNSCRGKGFGPFQANKVLDVLLYKSDQDLSLAIQSLDRISTLLKYNEENLPYFDLGNFGDKNPYIPFSLTLTSKQFNKLITYWYKNRVLRNLYLLGLRNKEIKNSHLDPLTLYKTCLENPYTVTSIPIDKCDEIMFRYGKKIEQEFHLCGRIVRKISQIMNSNGWTGIPLQNILSSFPDFETYIPLLKNEFGIEIDYETVYLNYAYEAEVEVSEWIKKMISSPPFCPVNDISFSRDDLSKDQILSIQNSLQNNISIITGEGGSGKTTCIRELVFNLEKNEIPYRLSSFTGKAVSRIRDVTGKKEPMTLHMMISKQKEKKIDKFQYLIIDESSMVTTDLIYQIRKRFTHDFHLVLIGDVNQLQPIGWGSFFSSLIASQKIPTVKLETNHRTNSNGILLNSKKIIACKEKGFTFVITDEFKILSGNLETVSKFLKLMNDNGFPFDKIVIISPFVKDLTFLNSMCSMLYNSLNRKIVDSRGVTWRIGDRVMTTENNYKYDLTNGTEGIIIDCDENTFDVKFKDCAHRYSIGEINEEDDETCKELNSKQLIHSFACSVHRLQGSEYDYVIGYIPEKSGNSTFLNKNLLYTMISRAKKNIWLIGDIPTMERAAGTKPGYRHENLVSRLAEK